MARAALGTAFRHLSELFGSGTVAGMEDGQLLARFSSSRDEVAFSALVARHGPMVLATCRAVLRNEHDVEDAFQTTFLVMARKASSIRTSDSVGAWLHRIAYRAAVQAGIEAKTRRQKEAEASAMASLRGSGLGTKTDHDLRHAVHEEIERLPEKERLPVVLCDLEGLSYEQAAEQLRLTVPAFRCRLAKARQRLKARLARLGFVTPTTAAAFPPEAAECAVVPAALLRSTVLAATGGPVSAGTLLLTRALLKGMLMTEIKFVATAGLAALALISAGVLTATNAGHEDSRPAPAPAAKAVVLSAEKPAAKKPVERIQVRGQVVAPDGKPVEGARVCALTEEENESTFPLTTSGANGRFSLQVAKAELDGRKEGYRAIAPWLVASAPGYGVGWAIPNARAGTSVDHVITLVEEGPPIEGRLVDLEGRPVVGADVRVRTIWFDDQGDISRWIAKARKGAAGMTWQGLRAWQVDGNTRSSRSGPREPIAKIQATTGTDGRFILKGVGRDRIADVMVSGPGIATTKAQIFSRDEPEFRSIDRGMMRRESMIIHAPKFQLALAPVRRIEGTIRDKDSAKPIAGLELQAAVFEESSLIPAPGIYTKTDDHGGYTIDGLPKAPAYRLFIRTGKGIPYTNATVKIPAESPGMEPIKFDLVMKRGVFVRGRVVDKVTGRRIKGYANYYAFSDNPHVGEYSGFAFSYPQYGYFDDDGRYELVALPGRGIIAVRDEGDAYMPARGYKKIAGYDAEHDYFNTEPHYLHPGGHVAIAEVNVEPNAEAVTLDLQVDPGKSVPIEVVGPDGGPLGDTEVKGLHELFQSGPVPQPSSSFEVVALDPSKPRRVIVLHEVRKLIGSALLKGDETGPVTIKLEPWGSVSGRIVDDEGHPRKAMFINSPTGSSNPHPETHDILPGSDWNEGIRVADDGTFFVEGLVPGLKYGATARTGFEAFGDLFTDVTVETGEVKNLGDLKVQPPKKTKE